MKIILAPMEGVIDYHMRSILTGIGGYDTCVTEFLRVSDHVLPNKVFRRLSPELNNKGLTETGVPVHLQLLGSDPHMMAKHASIGVGQGAPAIDINFGCPSKIVNRKMGGSVLLREPDRVHEIVSSVRKAVDNKIPVTAKMRLGYDDESLTLENALAIQSAGASEIVVHARTKVDGYKRPARWEAIAPIREAVNIPLIANGDIVTYDDYQQCVEISGCRDVMLGRGALINPSLARQIKAGSKEGGGFMELNDIARLILKLLSKMQAHYPQKCIVMRLKQWGSMLQKHSPAGKELFSEIRSKKSVSDINKILESLTSIKMHTSAHIECIRKC